MHGALKKLTYESGLASRRLGYCMRLSRMSDGDRPLNDDGDDAHSWWTILRIQGGHFVASVASFEAAD